MWQKLLGCPWKFVTIVRELVYNLFKGHLTYLSRGYNLFTTYHGHPSSHPGFNGTSTIQVLLQWPRRYIYDATWFLPYFPILFANIFRCVPKHYWKQLHSLKLTVRPLTKWWLPTLNSCSSSGAKMLVLGRVPNGSHPMAWGKIVIESINPKLWVLRFLMPPWKLTDPLKIDGYQWHVTPP